MADAEQVRSQLLAVLVADLGYRRAPRYGHSPMRHQFAWDFATETISPNTRRKEVRRIASQNAKEKRIIAARKERAKT